ncbi:hypothetical protein L7F22_037782 [Adiantum nelumboides]|nr:hypothetical protein [Adiantum nelumboides]
MARHPKEDSLWQEKWRIPNKSLSSSLKPSHHLSRKSILHISELVNEMAYQLKLPNHWLIHSAFHVSLLKPSKGEPPREAITEDPPEVEGQEEVLQPEFVLRHEDKVLRHGNRACRRCGLSSSWLQLNTAFRGRYLAPPSTRCSGLQQKKELHITMRGGGPNRQGGRGRGGGGRGSGRGGGGELRWWDPQWRAERLKQMRAEWTLWRWRKGSTRAKEILFAGQGGLFQRKGRAGRVQPGPKLVYEAMPQYQLPEILRTPLQELCLQIKSLQLGRIAEFLSKALQPPEPLAVQNAIDLLVTIGALNEAEELTPLGCHLATLPMDPRIGKMLLIGAIFQCLGPALTIAAALGHRDPFVLPIDRKEAADEARKRFARESYSDHIAILRAFEGWQMAKRDGRDRQYCWRNYLSSATLNLMDEMRF